MLRYAGLIKNDFTDGNGVCVSFWTQGCPHRCPGCHNPETWDFDGGQELPKDYLEQIDSAIAANGIQRNFSILGGEPLCIENIFLTRKILEHVKETFPQIKTFVWTGYVLENLENSAYKFVVEGTLELIDVLIDGPYIAEQRDVTLPLRGSRNQRILYRGKDF